MSFRTRLALVAAAAVGIAVVAASVAVFIVVHNELFGEVDRALHDRAVEIASGPPAHLDEGYLDIPGPAAGVQSDFVQAVPTSGPPFVQRGARFVLPVSERDHAAAEGGHGLYFSVKRFHDTQYRVLTISATPYALQVYRPLTEVNRTLHRITLFLILIAAGGMAVAAALGLLVARTALAPVRRLTATTEAVTETRDLSQRIESTSTGDDELGRLASSFNTMLAALEDSSRAQRQLVADASHELRTPLTSLKTNIEVLARANELSPESREQLLRDLVEQIDEMTALIGELIELAREARPDAVAEPARDVRLDLVAADAIERTRRNRPGVEFETDFDESVVHGAPSTIERAGRGRDPSRRGLGARPWSGDRRRRPALRVRPLLPLPRRARDARLGPRPRDRQAGGRVARRLGGRRAATGRRDPDATAAERPPARLLATFQRTFTCFSRAVGWL
jgi:two-component system sensor histidine kinase MprB